MLAHGETGEILFFKMRDDVFYPTLKLLHKCRDLVWLLYKCTKFWRSCVLIMITDEENHRLKAYLKQIL